MSETPTASAGEDLMILNNQVQMKRYFVKDSRLRRYLHNQLPGKNIGNGGDRHFFLATVLQHLKGRIADQILYDQKNPCIVLCDPELDLALNVRALHLSELR